MLLNKDQKRKIDELIHKYYLKMLDMGADVSKEQVIDLIMPIIKRKLAQRNL